jgi:tubulin beta
MEFMEAESACGDVISEYCCYNDCTETTDEWSFCNIF